MQVFDGPGAILELGIPVCAADWPWRLNVMQKVPLGFDRGRTASVFASFESAEHQALTVITPAAVHRLERPFTPLDDPIAQYRLMVESFADSILRGRPVAIPPSESVANMRVLDRIRAAASP